MMNLHNLKYFKRPEDIILFVKVFFSILGIMVLLNKIRLPRLLRLVEPKKRVVVNNMKIEHITTFADFILFRILKSSNPCMLKSLILFRYLRLMGMDIRIAFGVKYVMEELKGHAWLVYNERHFLEQEDPSSEYEVMLVYP